jgi:hypothetical protein
MGKRGAKAKHGTREPNGRLSRKPIDVTTRLNGTLDTEERETLRIGVEARHRLHGLNPNQLRDTDAGSFVGRLRLGDLITMQQCEAAIRYASAFHDMQATLSGPKPSGAIDLNATHGMPGLENEARTIKAQQTWRGVQAAIQAKQNEMHGTSNLYAALDYCVIRDADCPHMLPWLTVALDVCARHFQIGDKHRKAA